MKIVFVIIDSVYRPNTQQASHTCLNRPTGLDYIKLISYRFVNSLVVHDISSKLIYYLKPQNIFKADRYSRSRLSGTRREGYKNSTYPDFPLKRQLHSWLLRFRFSEKVPLIRNFHLTVFHFSGFDCILFKLHSIKNFNKIT